MRLLAIVASVLVAAAACGSEDDASVASGSGARPSAAAPGRETRYTATATVLESPDHGPQLCLGGVEESYPPQCRGPAVVGWDWGAIDGEESASGTTWGTYTVVGTWDGESLTLTERPAPADGARRSEPEPARSSTPCAEPQGGWRVVDAAKASAGAMQAAIDYARSRPTFGGAWVDQSTNPALDEVPVDEARANDPTKLVLNLTFTDDVAHHEEAIREIWGGALCVSEASASAAELSDIRAEVEAAVGQLLFSSVDAVRGRLEVGVPVDGGLQQRFDERYGPGVVQVRAQLRPVDE
ncbi:MAG TPA: hypothetical protein VM263_07740 [Acidimicrobiales bacterium]|nr:hypothetical protein [Acidimicrobiales bacterium]